MQAGTEEQTEMIIGLGYIKGERRQSLYVRMAAQGETTGVFRFETRLSDCEEIVIEFESSDVYAMQRRFVAKVLDLYADGWKRTRVCDGEASARRFMQYFDPRLFCAAEKPNWPLQEFSPPDIDFQAKVPGLGVSVTGIIALVIWTTSLPVLVWISRHFLPLMCVFIVPIVFSGAIALIPDGEVLKRSRIGWRVFVIVSGILYSGLLIARR